MRKFLRFISKTLLLTLACLTIASFMGSLNFVLEFLSHSRPLFCLAAFLITMLMLVQGSKRGALIGAALILLNSVQIISLYIPYTDDQEKPEARIKILQMNIWGGKNHEVTAVKKEIQSEDADIIGISEITKNWWAVIKPVASKYPYQVVQPSFGGICLLSKYPMRNGRVEHFGPIKRPRVVAEVNVRGQWIAVVFAHPIIPMRHPGMRDGELEVIAKDTSSTGKPTILAGDLNCTPFSYFFYKLERDGKLRDSEKGFGYQPSWSTFHWMPMFCIDHCLFSSEFTALKRYNGHNVGSDHLPVITELSLHLRK